MFTTGDADSFLCDVNSQVSKEPQLVFEMTWSTKLILGFWDDEIAEIQNCKQMVIFLV